MKPQRAQRKTLCSPDEPACPSGKFEIAIELKAVEAINKIY